MVTAAMSPDREYPSLVADKQGHVVADVTGKFSIDKLSERNGLGQVGAAGWGLFLHHAFSLCGAAALPSDSHAEKFLASQRIVAKTAKHTAGNQIRIRFMNAARGHAMM